MKVLLDSTATECLLGVGIRRFDFYCSRKIYKFPSSFKLLNIQCDHKKKYYNNIHLNTSKTKNKGSADIVVIKQVAVEYKRLKFKRPSTPTDNLILWTLTFRCCLVNICWFKLDTRTPFGQLMKTEKLLYYYLLLSWFQAKH